MPRLTQILSLTIALSCAVESTAAVTGIAPRVCKPGETTQLTVTGKDLNQSLRAFTNCRTANIKVESVEAEKAIINVTLPPDAAVGPLGLWLSSDSGPQAPFILLSDDLPVVADAADHQSLATAQPIPTLVAVDGTLEAAKSDFYRIQVSEGQRVSIEVRTQAIESAIDPVVRILDIEGKTIRRADDSDIGPDVRLVHQFEVAGDYIVQIQENAHRAGAYYLRVGDFPALHPAEPLVVQRGTAATIRATIWAASPDEPVEATIQLPTDFPGDTAMVGMRAPDGKSSAWVRVGIADQVQVTESAAVDQPLEIPIGMSGRLAEPNESDHYTIRGIKDKQYTFRARARSLNCPSLVRMQLHDAANKEVAKTEVGATDEWSFDYTFPDDGDYTLHVTDLLHRGGADFGYWIGIEQKKTFRVFLKADAATRTEFAIEPTNGASPIDLQVDRQGYDGPIQIDLGPSSEGLAILNPTIPAKAKEARIYVAADESWKPESSERIALFAKQTDQAGPAKNPVEGLGLYRVKSPTIPFPVSWRGGIVSLAGVAASESYFALKPTAEIEFARPVKTHVAGLTLERINAEFKSAVTILGNALPDGWSVAAKADKEAYTATLTRTDQTTTDIEKLSLAVFGEFNGRGRIETIDLPVRWIDPIRINVAPAKPIVAGAPAKLLLAIERQGTDPQPATLKWKDIPAGIAMSETVSIAADQTSVEVDITVSPEAEVESDFTLAFDLTSKYQGHDFTISGQTSPLTRIDLPTQLAIYPSVIHLPGPRHQQRLVVSGHDANEVPRDWSRDVHLSTTNPEVAEVREGILYPKQNGETDLIAEIGGVRQTVPVQVTGIETTTPIEFESEVLVALSKQGCNSGACHGSPSGKGMFRLSLRAFDKKLDELTLIREDFGRRVNRIEPEKSLLLMKPTMAVSHGGGKQLHKEDPAFAILRQWVAEGAKVDSNETPRPTRLEIFPDQKQILKRTGGGCQLAVTAHFADGSKRDVTHLVAYETSDTSIATVSEDGWVSPGGRGEAMVLVRYLEFIESIAVMFVDQVPDFQWNSPPEANYIDELVNAKLMQLQYLPSETCSDAEFLRRVYLDLIGILPTVAEADAFLADNNEHKRIAVIDSLLQRDEFAKFWALKWGDLLKMTGKLVGQEGVYKYHRWVEQALSDNMPYDQFARQLITASGSTLANPPANFYRTATDTNDRVETISQVFLGARLQCAKCHNHPFERWTQDNYYGLSAFFHRVQKRNTQRPGEVFVWTSTTGDVTQPRTGEKMTPWVPGQGDVEADNDSDRRETFADWLVSAENPYFAKIEANRLWSQLFSRGIVDPIDDFRDSNPPSNEPLLAALADDFVKSGFDRKHLLRRILNSRTYQASFRTSPLNEADTAYFSHQQPRLLAAEQLLDAVNHLLDLPETLGGLPAGTKATQMPAPDIVKVEFLKVFGQPERSTVCACERAEDSNLGMAIELFNGNTIHGKLRDENNRFRQAVKAGEPVEKIVGQLYMAAFSRPPNDSEIKTALEHCATRDEVADGLEDICWALLNTDEFLFQH